MLLVRSGKVADRWNPPAPGMVSIAFLSIMHTSEYREEAESIPSATNKGGYIPSKLACNFEYPFSSAQRLNGIAANSSTTGTALPFLVKSTVLM